jgi:hypothetical protein
MAQAYIFNGIFNTLVIGYPVWVWTLIGLVVVVLLTNMYWYFMFWSPLFPLHGLWRASWGKTDATLLSDKDINLKLTSERNSKVIFDETIEEAKKNEKGWKNVTSGSFGVVGTDIILDLDNWTKPNSEEKHIIQEAADNWNMDHPEDQIHSFYKFMQYLEDDKIDVAVPKHMLVEWLRIEAAFPKNRNTSGYAGYVRQLAEKLDKEQKQSFMDAAMYLLIGSGFISALFIIYKFIQHKP